MKQSEKLKKQYDQLRSQIIGEIRMAHKKHTDIEIEPEIEVLYVNGMDEQDESYNIQQVETTEVVVFHQGNEIERVVYEYLTTSTLIKLLEAMEKSLVDAEKFLSK